MYVAFAGDSGRDVRLSGKEHAFAKKILPLTKARDGQYRVKASSQLAYLSVISRAYVVM